MSLTTKVIIMFAMLASPLLLADDDPAETCTNAAALYKDGDLEGAIEEAEWCLTQFKQLRQGQTASYFKNEIAGYKAGELNQQSTMGFSIIERSYTKDGKRIKVTLSAGDAGAATNAFAALAAMGGMNSGQGKKIRIQRRTANMTVNNGKAKLNVSLKSGGFLNFESGDVSPNEVITFAKEFPVKDLDESRK